MIWRESGFTPRVACAQTSTEDSPPRCQGQSSCSLRRPPCAVGVDSRGDSFCPSS